MQSHTYTGSQPILSMTYTNNCYQTSAGNYYDNKWSKHNLKELHYDREYIAN
jgi:hypothetical protein